MSEPEDSCAAEETEQNSEVGIVYTQEKEDEWYSHTQTEEADQSQDLEESHRQEIRAALRSGHRTITLSADDTSLEAKIAEIVRQSRLTDQGENGEQQYIEIVNGCGEMGSDNEAGNQIGLMNFRLIRYDDSGSAEVAKTEEEEETMGEIEEEEQQYVQFKKENVEESETSQLEEEETDPQGLNHPPGMQYVQVVEHDQVPLVYFTVTQPDPPKPPVHKQFAIRQGMRPGRRKRGEFNIPPHVMDSPNFKLYLYNCKMCDFKCNAIKELTVHKATHPGMGSGRYRSLAKPPLEKATEIEAPPPFIAHCDKCKFKATTRLQMNRHISRYHVTKTKLPEGSSKSYHTYETQTTEGLITYYCCRLCSFKSTNKHQLKRHHCKETTLQDPSGPDKNKLCT